MRNDHMHVKKCKELANHKADYYSCLPPPMSACKVECARERAAFIVACVLVLFVGRAFLALRKFPINRCLPKHAESEG
jgi:hypothetical protein